MKCISYTTHVYLHFYLLVLFIGMSSVGVSKNNKRTGPTTFLDPHVPSRDVCVQTGLILSSVCALRIDPHAVLIELDGDQR